VIRSAPANNLYCLQEPQGSVPFAVAKGDAKQYILGYLFSSIYLTADSRSSLYACSAQINEIENIRI
jgi:hypothetical protein